MSDSSATAVWKNFLGAAPAWYKKTIVAFLLLNPVLLYLLGPFVTGWLLIGEFIFTLALALRCYPLQPSGLLAIEAVLMGMTTPHTVFEETVANFEVILLLMFMVAGIYFMKELLLFVFTRILLSVRSKVVLSLLFCLVSAFLSAFLDALTVTAVLISVGVGFFSVYHKIASGKNLAHEDKGRVGDFLCDFAFLVHHAFFHPQKLPFNTKDFAAMLRRILIVKVEHLIGKLGINTFDQVGIRHIY